MACQLLIFKINKIQDFAIPDAKCMNRPWSFQSNSLTNELSFWNRFWDDLYFIHQSDLFKSINLKIEQQYKNGYISTLCFCKSKLHSQY